MDHPAARSSASSEAKGVRASTSLVGGFLDFLALLFCGLLFFAARLRLIFAFRFLAMCLLQILFQGKHATKHHTFRNSHSLRSCEDHTIKNSIEFAQHHCAVRTKRFLAPGVASSPSLFNPRKQR